MSKITYINMEKTIVTSKTQINLYNSYEKVNILVGLHEKTNKM